VRDTMAPMPKLQSATTRALAVVAGVTIGFDLTAASCGASPAATRTNNGQDSTPPPPSVGHALVYHDTLGQVLLLNAGLGTAADAQRIGRPTRIWAWTGSRWNLLDSLGPPVRNLAGVAYDSRRNVIVLHGGTASETLNYGDTWEWGRTGWVKKADGAGPGVRSHTQMAYDRARRRSVLFGGQNATGDAFPNDTWEWDGSTWTRAATSGPPPRVHHAMTYDPVAGHVIVFGGVQPNVGELGDAWSWDGTRWTPLASSTPRTHAQLSTHPTTGRPVVVGGLTPGGPATTMLMLESNAWTAVAVDGPSPRYLPALALDPVRRILVLFAGGAVSGMAVYADTWEFDGTRWRKVP